ncbi:MAG: acyltransferase [Planctomycetes bacterium]|nr:acyltransferase [Planctomycetota bacterium]
MLFYLFWEYGASWVPFYVGRLWRRLVLKRTLKRCGRGVNLSTNVRIEYPWNIELGERVWIGNECRLEGMGGIRIGNDASLAFQTALQTAGHEFAPGRPIREQPVVARPIVICDDAWLGARTMVRYGVTIGAGAVVAMGAVVTEDVPPGEVWGGVPARRIGTRGSSAPPSRSS